jgi:hypothetical protein
MVGSQGWEANLKDQWKLRESQFLLCRSPRISLYVRYVLCGVRTRLLEGRECWLVKERSVESVCRSAFIYMMGY